MTSITFGTRTAPHMLRQRCRDGRWQAPEIVPFGQVSISPLAKSLNYGQSVFEGMKAYRGPTGDVALFRPRDHLLRLQRSALRLCMPAVDVDIVLDALTKLVAMDQDAVPDRPGSLYLRPVLFANEGTLSPRPSNEYELVIVLCPVDSYLDAPAGLRLTTTTDYVRAAPGGTGAAKCAGNYAAPMWPTEQAKADGFDEVVWLDAVHRRYLEEAGTMNVFYVRDGRLLTPPTSDTILAGITRDCLQVLAHEAGFDVGEERISTNPPDWTDVDEVLTSGTAAGVMTVRELRHDGNLLFTRETPGPVYHDLSTRLDEARFGLDGDRHGWLHPVTPLAKQVSVRV